MKATPEPESSEQPISILFLETRVFQTGEILVSQYLGQGTLVSESSNITTNSGLNTVIQQALRQKGLVILKERINNENNN